MYVIVIKLIRHISGDGYSGMFQAVYLHCTAFVLEFHFYSTLTTGAAEELGKCLEMVRFLSRIVRNLSP